jgi:hypothetical protein
MTATLTRRRPTETARRSGYLFAAVINAAVLYLTFVRPTWRCS